MGIFSSFRGLLRSRAEEAASVSDSDAAFAGEPDLAAEAGLLASLRAAPPRLSAWLDLLLSGVEETGSLLESRLLLLFRALETPEGEAARFVGDFSAWLGKMGYSRLEEFRSELQYRLALTLDLEDEEDEQNRLLLKLGQGLAVTRARLGQGLNALFQPGRVMDESFWEDLEEALLLGDVGMEAAGELSKRLRARALREGVGDPASLRGLLREEIAAIFRRGRRIQVLDKPEVILLVGVNGAGKTTTIAKLAHRYVLQGKKTLVAAADTFRAAAVDQLDLWTKRAGADFYARPGGGDPAAVAYEATDKALREGYDALLVDTAGRLQTKSNLMDELSKIRRVMGKVMTGAPQRIILVLDANIGQNALSQVKLFGGGGVNELILTKLDGTAKGGAAVSVALSHELPITYIGLGEKMEDLRPFDGEAFASALLGEERL